MASKQGAKPESLSFEKTIDKLEKLIEKMDDQDSSLMDSLGAFEEGIALIAAAQNTLSAVEQRVNTLLADSATAASEDEGQTEA